MFIFFPGKENEPKETAVSRLPLRVAQPIVEAAPNAAMRRCPNRSGAHNRSIAARLASLAALPDSMMLASSTD
jgi:Flp pilus assembly protein protease CpaA